MRNLFRKFLLLVAILGSLAAFGAAVFFGVLYGQSTTEIDELNQEIVRLQLQIDPDQEDEPEDPAENLSDNLNEDQDTESEYLIDFRDLNEEMGFCFTAFVPDDEDSFETLLPNDIKQICEYYTEKFAGNSSRQRTNLRIKSKSEGIVFGQASFADNFFDFEINVEREDIEVLKDEENVLEF